MNFLQSGERDFEPTGGRKCWNTKNQRKWCGSEMKILDFEGTGSERKKLGWLQIQTEFWAGEKSGPFTLGGNVIG